MTRFKDFPHPIINVKDESQVDVVVSEDLPLHRPLFLSYAEKGEANTIQYGTFSEIVKKIGKGTFDEFSSYFKHPNLFLRLACQNQPIFFARVVPEDAAVASKVVEAHVWDADIPQWERDGESRFTTDVNGDKIPIINAPTIDDLSWDSWDQDESTAYELTVSATDPNSVDLTYDVTCDDATVTIVPQADPNDHVFDITYPDYTADTNHEVTFTITVTNGTETITSTLVMFVNPDGNPMMYGHYTNNDDHCGNCSYEMTFKGSATGTLVYTLTCDNVDVTLTQDLIAEDLWVVEYQTMDVATDVEFTMDLTDTDATETTFENRTFNVGTIDLTQSTEAGMMLRWVTRELTTGETISSIINSTYVEGADTITVYPIFAFTPKLDAGVYGNNMGLQLWWDSEVDQDTVIDTESMLYKIAIVDKPYGLDSPVFVRDFFDNGINDFAFNPVALDATVNMRLDFENVMNNNYRDKLPFDFHVYSDNVATIGTSVLAVEDVLRIPELTTEWMVNIFEAMTTDSVPYYNLVIDIEDVDSALLEENVIHYLSGGADGTLSDANLETLTQLWLTGSVFPEVKDQARYPFNHLYDSGYSLDTKESLINFMSIREDVNIIISTQDATEEPNTKAEDQSAGSSLRTTALLHPESVLYGTQCCRVTQFMQCGYINFSTTYKKVVPFTLAALYNRCICHNADYIKKEWKGLPNSSVDMFSWVNWTPSSDDVKQLSWDTGLNYVQYYDMTRFHYPDIVSIYPFHTSIMSSDLFTTYLVYMKQIVRQLWATYSGLSESVNKLSGMIKKKLDPLLYYTFKEYMTVDTSIYQTDEDAMLGYSMTVELQVYDSVSKRVWNVPIKVRRIEDRG